MFGKCETDYFWIIWIELNNWICSRISVNVLWIETVKIQISDLLLRRIVHSNFLSAHFEATIESFWIWFYDYCVTFLFFSGLISNHGPFARLFLCSYEKNIKGFSHFPAVLMLISFLHFISSNMPWPSHDIRFRTWSISEALTED